MNGTNLLNYVRRVGCVLCVVASAYSVRAQVGAYWVTAINNSGGTINASDYQADFEVTGSFQNVWRTFTFGTGGYCSSSSSTLAANTTHVGGSTFPGSSTVTGIRFRKVSDGSIVGTISGQTASSCSGGYSIPGSVTFAGPTSYCGQVQIANDTAVPHTYELVSYPGGTPSTSSPLTLNPGVSGSINLGPFVNERPPAILLDWVGTQPDVGETTLMSYPTNASFYYNCGATATPTNTTEVPKAVPNQPTTNAPVDFSGSGTASDTSAAKNGDMKTGFQAMTTAIQGLADITQHGFDKLHSDLVNQEGIMGGMTNELGSIDGKLGTVTNELGGMLDKLAAATNYLQNTTNLLGRLGDTNVLNTVRTNTAGMLTILQGGATNSDYSSAISDGQSRASTALASDSYYSGLGSDIVSGTSTKGTIDSASWTRHGGADSFLQYDLTGYGFAGASMDFDPRSNALISTAVDWIRLFLEAMLNLSFFLMCHRRAQRYLWDLLIASQAKPIAGGAITELGNRTVGYLMVTATMATIATVPAAVVSFMSDRGGWSGVFSGFAHYLMPSATGSTAEKILTKGIDLANWFLPLQVIVTMAISRVIYELTIAQVCLAALTVLRFIKIFSIALLLSQVSSWATQFHLENWSGQPVTNLLGTNQMIYPAGVTALDCDISTTWSFTGGIVDIDVSDGDRLRFSVETAVVESSHTALFWFNLGFGAFTAVWGSSRFIAVYRTRGREIVNAAGD